MEDNNKILLVHLRKLCGVGVGQDVTLEKN